MHVHAPASAHHIVDADADSAHAHATAPDPRLAKVEHALAHAPKHAESASGHHAGNVNIAFVGSKSDLEKAFAGGGWTEAKQGLQSDIDYAQHLARHQIDPDAPVSDRYMFGRKQDVSFERATAVDARHHVRFWDSGERVDGQPVWVGAGSYDDKITLKPGYADSLLHGIEHGHVSAGELIPTTHHVDGNIDKERETIAGALVKGGAQGIGTIAGEHHGHTDGRIDVLVAGPHAEPPSLGIGHGLDVAMERLQKQLSVALPKGETAHAPDVLRDPRPPMVRSLMVAHGAAQAAHAASPEPHAALAPARATTAPAKPVAKTGEPVVLGYYGANEIPHLIAAVKHGKLPATSPVYIGTYGIDGKSAKQLHAAGLEYAPMFTMKDANTRYEKRSLTPAETAKLHGFAASAKFAGKPPSIAGLSHLSATARIQWGAEVGMRIRDHMRKTGVKIDTWQMDEILGESRGSGTSAVALRQYERGILTGLTYGRPSLGDKKMQGVTWFAHSALSLADQPDTPELRRFWKTVNDSSFRVAGEEYPNFAGSAAAAAHTQSHGERALAAAGGVKGAIARKYMAGLTPGYHNPGGGLGGNSGGHGAAWVNGWREAYMTERMKEGADGIAEYSWVAGNATQKVMNDVMSEIGVALRAKR